MCKALARDPGDRYQSAGEFHDALIEVTRWAGIYATRDKVAKWMQTRYSRQLDAQNKRIAELWDRLAAVQQTPTEVTAELSSDQVDAIPRAIPCELSNATTKPYTRPAGRRKLALTGAKSACRSQATSTIDTLEVPSRLRPTFALHQTGPTRSLVQIFDAATSKT